MTSSGPSRGENSPPSTASETQPTHMTCQNPDRCAAKAAHHEQMVQKWMPLGEALHEALLRGLASKHLHLLGIGHGRVNAHQVENGVSARDIIEVIEHGRPIACFAEHAWADVVLLDHGLTRSLHVRVRLSVTWPEHWQRQAVRITANAVLGGYISIATPAVLGVEDPANKPVRWQKADGYSLPHCFCDFPADAAPEDAAADNSQE